MALVVDSSVIVKAPKDKFLNFVELLRIFADSGGRNLIVLPDIDRKKKFLQKLSEVGFSVWISETPKAYLPFLGVLLWRVCMDWKEDLVLISDEPQLLPILQVLSKYGARIKVWSFGKPFCGSVVQAYSFSPAEKNVFLLDKQKMWLNEHEVLYYVPEEELDGEVVK